MARTIDLPHFTGQVPYATEQAIQRLREHLETALTENDTLRATIAALPPPLTLPEIQQALSPTGAYPLPTAGALNTTPPPSGGIAPPPPATAPNHLDIAQAALATLGINASSTPEELFRYAQLVAWNVQALGTDPPGWNVGLLMQGSGSGVFNCAGINYASFRICYSNGANIKILTGSFVAEWLQEANIPLSDYHVPTDPASAC